MRRFHESAAEAMRSRHRERRNVCHAFWFGPRAFKTARKELYWIDIAQRRGRGPIAWRALGQRPELRPPLYVLENSRWPGPLSNPTEE